MVQKKIMIQPGVQSQTIGFPPQYQLVSTGDLAADRDIKREIEYLVVRAGFRLDTAVLDRLPDLRAVALVSTGTDNIDLLALEKRGIRLFSGEGANARAVRDYVVQSLLYLYEAFPVLLAARVGIVGYGHTGRQLGGFLSQAGLKVAYYDPFLPEPGSLAETLAAEIVSFHVPLSGGPHATRGMLGPEYFAGQKIPWLLQTCRGQIWQTAFYQKLLAEAKIWAQDVYPEEPPEADWVRGAEFSTPHIAGYSTIGRLGGVQRSLGKMFSSYSENFEVLPLPESAVWDLREESERLKENPSLFGQRRDRFPWRKELWQYSESEQNAFAARFRHIPENVFRAAFAPPESLP